MGAFGQVEGRVLQGEGRYQGKDEHIIFIHEGSWETTSPPGHGPDVNGLASFTFHYRPSS